ncbi:EF-hand domain-containing protein [Thiothrix sp.]|uniref:EF-hand domain-containing protein n=1 Tax=Thiothrix sp. TaxID=1032 RepID=UPI00258057D9|nr:EF-hand domain-containing protein [Thiothrix sp.]
MKTKLLLLAVVGALLSSTAFAADFQGRGSLAQIALQYDANRNGVITRPEFAGIGGTTADFTVADTNVDGYLSWTEFKAWRDAKQVAQIDADFTAADTDLNRILSATEFTNATTRYSANQATAATVFFLGDTDGDTVLTLDELSAMRVGYGSAEKLMWGFALLDSVVDKQLSLTEFTSKPTPVPPTGMRRR